MKTIAIDTPIRILGRSLRTSYHLEANPATCRIPAHWQKFAAMGGVASIPEADASTVEPTPVYAVYHHYASDMFGDYSVTVGAASQAKPSDGLEEAFFPAGKYVLVEEAGAIPACTIQAWQRIWEYFVREDVKVARAYRQDVEVYHGKQGVRLYIGIL